MKEGVFCDSIQQTDTSTNSNINNKETELMKDSSQVIQTSKSTNEIVYDTIK